MRVTWDISNNMTVIIDKCIFIIKILPTFNNMSISNLFSDLVWKAILRKITSYIPIYIRIHCLDQSNLCNLSRVHIQLQKICRVTISCLAVQMYCDCKWYTHIVSVWSEWILDSNGSINLTSSGMNNPRNGIRAEKVALAKMHLYCCSCDFTNCNMLLY